MDYEIPQRGKGPRVRLTTESPASHYGVPALRIDDDSPTDYGPADVVLTPDFPAGAYAGTHRRSLGHGERPHGGGAGCCSPILRSVARRPAGPRPLTVEAR